MDKNLGHFLDVSVQKFKPNVSDSMIPFVSLFLLFIYMIPNICCFIIVFTVKLVFDTMSTVALRGRRVARFAGRHAACVCVGGFLPIVEAITNRSVRGVLPVESGSRSVGVVHTSTSCCAGIDR